MALQHLHMLTALDLLMGQGGPNASVRGVARYLHNHEGIGANPASVERTLHLLKAQQRAGSRNRRT